MTESRTPPRPRSHVVVMVVNLFIATTLIVVGVLVVWANNKVGDRLVVNIDGGTTSATTPDGAPAEDWAYDTSNLRAKNFLLTGSDNGACPDKGDGTSGGIGDRESFGERSDTIMVLRVDPAVNDVVVLSFPRDLWVKIAGTTREARINSAFDSKDPSRLIRTIADNFDVPIDHYVNVNLCAFKEIVDSVGGVKVPFAYRTKDERVGFREVGPGCVELRGSQALAYVRSRSGYRYFDEAKQQWLSDPTGDIGRITRQQDFLRRSMQRALDRGTTNPATANALLNVALARVITDDRLTPRDLLSLAQAMRKLNTSSVNSYTVEWSMRRIGGESVLMPITKSESMQAILALFRSQVAQGDESAFAPPSMRTASLVILPFAQLMLDILTSTDTTVPPAPQQERLGVFPPDDATCR
ncbi:MAG: LCP family protein [Ilumatobacteraceae bacterium]|nr:LCP family protein [Ilumatobacteraceae bacterium]